MANKRIGIHEFGGWARGLSGELRDAAERGLLSAAIRLQGHIITVVIPAEESVPVDRGVYRAGWRTKKIPKGAFVFNATPIAPLIEFGVRGDKVKIGRKLIDALTEWIKRKGIGGTHSKAAKKEYRQTSMQQPAWAKPLPTPDENARAIAWAIAQSLKKNGIFDKGKGLRILEKANRMVSKFVLEEVEAELKKARGGAR